MSQKIAKTKNRKDKEAALEAKFSHLLEVPNTVLPLAPLGVHQQARQSPLYVVLPHRLVRRLQRVGLSLTAL